MKLLVGFETDFMLDAQMTYKITPVGGNPTNVGYPITSDLGTGGYPAYSPNQAITTNPILKLYKVLV